ncbi:MAG: sulfurtransferase TusA family protein [Candidatus Hodarchaeota archaeon]
MQLFKTQMGTNMDDTGEIRKIKISRRKMIFKLIRLWLWSIIKRKWYLPEASEITVDHLLERINSNQSQTELLLIDLRDKIEFYGTGEYKYEKYGHIPNSQLIPLFELPSHFEELQPFKDKEIVTMCQGGGASLVAVDILNEVGFTDVKSLKGGIKKWHKKGYPLIRGTAPNESPSSPEAAIPSTFEGIVRKQPFDEKSISIDYSLDARGLICPQPIMKSKKKLKTLKVGQVLEILTTDPGSKRDIPAWAHVTGQELLVFEERGSKEFRFLVKRMK